MILKIWRATVWNPRLPKMMNCDFPTSSMHPESSAFSLQEADLRIYCSNRWRPLYWCATARDCTIHLTSYRPASVWAVGEAPCCTWCGLYFIKRSMTERHSDKFLEACLCLHFYIHWYTYITLVCTSMNVWNVCLVLCLCSWQSFLYTPMALFHCNRRLLEH